MAFNPLTNPAGDSKEQIGGKLASSRPSSISGIGIMTADRPALLERALKSYITGTKDRRDIEYVVFDDSKKASARRASFDTAKTIRRQTGVEVRFAGHEERATYISRLAECSAVRPEIVERGLLLSEGYTLGQNRNALLLESAGTLFFCADDDTLCIPALPPELAQTRLRVCSGEDPSEYWFYRDSTEARAEIRLVETDFLAIHEQLLGKELGELEAKAGLGNLGQSPPELGPSDRFKDRASAVRITFNGLLGDCAWGSPFGLWHEPMGYLAFTGLSLDRLLTSNEFYRQATLSRQLLRSTTCPVLADLSFSMLTFCGLDNREMLPPNPPSQRGQDLVFGQLLWKCFSRAVSGHVPLLLIHDPVPSRRFWPREIMRSSAGVDLSRLLVEAIRLCEFQKYDLTPVQRLKALGQHFSRLAQLPDKALGNVLRERLHESNQHFENKLTERARRPLPGGGGYTEDVTGFFAKVRMAELREDYWIPLDMWSIDGAAGASLRVRKMFSEFGELLQAWPAIFESATILRSHNVRISVRV